MAKSPILTITVRPYGDRYQAEFEAHWGDEPTYTQLPHVFLADSPLAAAKKAIAEIDRNGAHRSKRGRKPTGYPVASRMVSG